MPAKPVEGADGRVAQGHWVSRRHGRAFTMKTLFMTLVLAAVLPSALRADSSADQYKAQLLAADNAFSALAAKDGVFRAFMSVATEETKILSESGKGFDAVKSGYKGVPLTATLSWKPSDAETSREGDLGYTWGHYDYRDRTADGKSIVETGTYVTIWRRQPDGSWKVVLDGGSPDPKR
jgi:ketosteroid isomerase-like protein